MARPLRLEYCGAVYHITARGNARNPIFHSDNDRNLFLEILHKVTERFHWLCHVYCLMDNHYHLVVETPEGNISAGMRQLNGVYTQTTNRMHGRVGHVFQGRYKAILVQKENHLLEVCRYVVLNPVRANAANSPDDWKWSSYGATAGIEKPHGCLVVEWVLGQFDKNRQEAEKRYRKFVHAGIQEVSIWEKVKGQALLGNKEFIERFENQLQGKREIVEIPRSQRYADRPALEMLFRGVEDTETRNRVICEAVRTHGYRQSEVAGYIGIHYSTVSKIVAGDR
jgi:REP element-mobilizing transposase RayT